MSGRYFSCERCAEIPIRCDHYPGAPGSIYEQDHRLRQSRAHSLGMALDEAFAEASQLQSQQHSFAAVIVFASVNALLNRAKNVRQ